MEAGLGYQSYDQISFVFCLSLCSMRTGTSVGHAGGNKTICNPMAAKYRLGMPIGCLLLQCVGKGEETNVLPSYSLVCKM